MKDARALTGYALPDLIGRRPGDLWHGGLTDQRVVARMQASMRNGMGAEAELVKYRKDGQAFVVAIEVEPLRNQDGMLTGFMAIESDVTDARRAAEALQIEQERLELALDAGGLGLWDWNPKTGDLVIDRRWCEMLGYSPGDLPANTTAWSNLVQPDDLREAQRLIAACTDELMLVYEIEIRMRHRNGQWRWILTRGRITARDELGFPIRFVGAHQDITERKKAQTDLAEARDRAEAANRAKSDFLANMSHEIRTPLTTILGYTDLLREDGDLAAAPASRVRTIETIASAGRHLMSVISNILDISKIEADRMTVLFVETPLIAILGEVESFLRPAAANKGVALAFRQETPLPERIISEPTRLRQIITNLVANAVKFTESGSVIVSVRALSNDRGNRLQVDVLDTGPGMTPEQAQGIFDPFTQAESGMDRRFGGTGLGLTISKRLATLMGGDVTLERTTPPPVPCSGWSCRSSRLPPRVRWAGSKSPIPRSPFRCPRPLHACWGASSSPRTGQTTSASSRFTSARPARRSTSPKTARSPST